MAPPEQLGLIAGNRSLPLLVAAQAKKMGVGRVIAAAFENETDPAVAGVADEVVWLKVGQLAKLIEAFKSRGVKHCIMAGQIAPKNLFDLRPDWRAVKLLFNLKEKNAHTIFRAIADELAKDGIELIEATPWLAPLMPGAGYQLGPSPTADQQKDIEFGCRVAKEISRLDIGQLVVVKEGTVLAVEGFEGTDACLRRGGELAGKNGGAVAVKVAKQGHDMRFDIPCAGPATIENCGKSGVAVLALEAGKTLILEEEQTRRLAMKLNVSLITVVPASK